MSLEAFFKPNQKRMSGNLDLLQSEIGRFIVDGRNRSNGTDRAKTNNALTMGLPVLMKAMERNAKNDPDQAQDLMKH